MSVRKHLYKESMLKKLNTDDSYAGFYRISDEIWAMWDLPSSAQDFLYRECFIPIAGEMNAAVHSAAGQLAQRET